jgi:hypothetical protein
MYIILRRKIKSLPNIVNIGPYHLIVVQSNPVRLTGPGLEARYFSPVGYSHPVQSASQVPSAGTKRPHVNLKTYFHLVSGSTVCAHLFHASYTIIY